MATRHVERPAAVRGSLFDTDPHAAFLQSALHLREGRFSELEIEQLADEIEDMGRSIRRELASDLAIVIEHLLKLDHANDAPPRRGWRVSVDEHRARVHDLLRESPSLGSRWNEAMTKAWRRGANAARIALSADEAASLPAELPYTHEQLLDEGYFGEREAAA